MSYQLLRRARRGGPLVRWVAPAARSSFSSLPLPAPPSPAASPPHAASPPPSAQPPAVRQRDCARRRFRRKRGFGRRCAAHLLCRDLAPGPEGSKAAGRTRAATRDPSQSAPFPGPCIKTVAHNGGAPGKGWGCDDNRGGARKEPWLRPERRRSGNWRSMRKLARRTRSAHYSPAERSLEHASQLRREEAPDVGGIRWSNRVDPVADDSVLPLPHNLGLP